MATRAWILALVCACAPASEDAPTDRDTGTPAGPLAIVSGRAFVFGYDGRLAGAALSAVEDPSITAALAEDGTFSVEVPSRRRYSFVVTQPGFTTTQTARLFVPEGGLDLVGFQVPADETTTALAGAIGVVPDPARCQLVTTVSAAGGPPYGGVGVGEPGVIVRLDPPPSDDDDGPIYFAYLGESLPPIPSRSLTATSIDGGVLFANIPPGDYEMSAEKGDLVIPPIQLRCRAGVLVNAAPPRGLQVQ